MQLYVHVFTIPSLQEFTCDAADDVDGCLALENGSSNIIVLVNLDSGDIFKYNYDGKVQPIISEDYGEGGLEYYAVIGTRADSGVCGLGDSIGTEDLSGLKGATVCSSGYRRSSGWTFPVNYMIDNGIF